MPHLQAHLAHRFEEGQRLDVTHGAANFDDGHVHCVGRAHASATPDEILNLVGHVRNHLHRFAEVIATAFFFEHALVDLAGGEVIGLAHARLDEALVVAQVQISLGAIVGDEDLAVLKRRHRAGIDVEVGIELD